MARYSVAITKTTTAAAGNIAELRTSSTKDIRVWEIGVFMEAATAASTVLIGRPTVLGTGVTTALGQADDTSAGAAATSLDTGATGVTAPTVAMRRIVFPATVGAGVIWTWPNGLVVPVSAGLTVWQASSVIATYGVYAVFEE